MASPELFLQALQLQQLQARLSPRFWKEMAILSPSRADQGSSLHAVILLIVRVLILVLLKLLLQQLQALQALQASFPMVGAVPAAATDAVAAASNPVALATLPGALPFAALAAPVAATDAMNASPPGRGMG